ncbi:hypothetical protein BGZ99_001323 [Dissophora globulifera]|uniref:Cyclin N-terminal domain-containing protein n=1 Tax=Dissophora globulifera TaxID=979702 RepID=A0A9P6RNY0_9FUNG|nr:hypothetical protein BGZ99_001323 [Dissophora globulifera]
MAERYDRFVYMDTDSDSPSNRSTLIQWLLELCYCVLECQPTTLHVAVNLLDRYLSINKMNTPLEHLQCVGMCTLMIAGKLEENDARPTIVDLCRLCDLYTPQEIASMELAILAELKFEVLVASANGFSDYYKQAIPSNPELSELIDFLCDLSLISHKFLDFNTSQVAASAVWIALCATQQDWDEELAALTGYTRTDLTPCSMIFKDLICTPSCPAETLDHLGRKYPLEKTLATLTKVLQ